MTAELIIVKLGEIMGVLVMSTGAIILFGLFLGSLLWLLDKIYMGCISRKHKRRIEYCFKGGPKFIILWRSKTKPPKEAPLTSEQEKMVSDYLFDRPGAEVFDITRKPGETNEELKARIDGMGIFEEKRLP